MRANAIRTNLIDGKVIVNAWLSIPAGYSAEGIGWCGFDSVTVDMQHGMISYEAALCMLQAISATPAVPIVRVPSLDPPMIMRMLDSGAYGIICPMISTRAEAEALVSACRYPPVGTRSFGPSRGLLYGGTDYVAHANETVMVIPMIETPQAVEEIDRILSVVGVDMIYVGPNDLAMAMDGSNVGQTPKSAAAIIHILERAKKAGIPAGIFCADAEDASRRLEQGFVLVTPGNDFGTLTRAARAAVGMVRGRASELLPGGY
ncbi:MAG: 2,4-dihydroxyhept-2-ene-1,7-dioic acid aldolase [Proteobacteria bacterium]|nr:2,4-dihydroxyhept-2-ene-1,7-dioic acid aldolase [Pseudomonadota bacterium]